VFDGLPSNEATVPDTEKTQNDWDASTEARRAFALSDEVRAVIFCSDVAVVRKAERGPSPRLHDKLMRQIEGLLASGKHDDARGAIDQTSWRGPQTIWWTSSIPELTQVIERHDEIIRERKIAAGVSVEEFIPDSTIVFFRVWWDR
jgi:hypothetical protein